VLAIFVEASVFKCLTSAHNNSDGQLITSGQVTHEAWLECILCMIARDNARFVANYLDFSGWRSCSSKARVARITPGRLMTRPAGVPQVCND